MWIDKNDRIHRGNDSSSTPISQDDFGTGSSGSPSSKDESCLRFAQDGEPYYQLTDEVIIWPERYGVRVSGQWIDLTPTEIRVLTILVDEPGKVWTRYDLVKACHKGYTTVADRSMNYTIFQLRRKVPPFNYMIETVRNKGYRLNPQAKNHLLKLLILALVGLWAKWQPSGAIGWTSATAVTTAAVALPVTGVLVFGNDPLTTVDLWLHPAELIQVVSLESTPSNNDGTLLTTDRRIQGASSITSLGNDRYAIISDAPPNAWSTHKGQPARVQYVSLSLQPGENRLASLFRYQAMESIELRDAQDVPFIAKTNNFSRHQRSTPWAIDPEGIAATPWGTLWIAEEQSSLLREFSREGKLIQELPLPDRFKLLTERYPAHSPDAADKTGPDPLRGLANVTMSPDGRFLFAACQSPLLQDGGRKGEWIRLLKHDLISSTWREYAYPLESSRHVLTDLLALDDTTLLSIEHSLTGDGRQCQSRVYRIQIGQATDLTPVACLPENQSPGWLRSVAKSLWINPSSQITPQQAGSRHLPMFQGIALGPTLPDGRSSVLLISDNGHRSQWPSVAAVFAINRPLSNDFSASR